MLSAAESVGSRIGLSPRSNALDHDGSSFGDPVYHTVTSHAQPIHVRQARQSGRSRGYWIEAQIQNLCLNFAANAVGERAQAVLR
jgi:hypothetical protein